MSYEFQSTLFATRADLCAAIAEQFISAGGLNGAATIAEIFASQSDESLAADCIEGWGLARPAREDDEESWMASRGIDASDIVAALADLRGKYPSAGQVSRIALDQLDHNLAGDIADDEADDWELYSSSVADARVANQGHQILWSPSSSRAGIVFVGSGSSGQTSWTDAESPADALGLYLRDEMRP